MVSNRFCLLSIKYALFSDCLFRWVFFTLALASIMEGEQSFLADPSTDKEMIYLWRFEKRIPTDCMAVYYALYDLVVIFTGLYMEWRYATKCITRYYIKRKLRGMHDAIAALAIWNRDRMVAELRRSEVTKSSLLACARARPGANSNIREMRRRNREDIDRLCEVLICNSVIAVE